jgi:hypothetical protein
VPLDELGKRDWIVGLRGVSLDNEALGVKGAVPEEAFRLVFAMKVERTQCYAVNRSGSVVTPRFGKAPRSQARLSPGLKSEAALSYYDECRTMVSSRCA